MALQDEALGSNLICANPLALLAVMKPVWPEVTSLIVTLRPFAVSPKATLSLSPDFMNRSLALGVKLARVEPRGLAGPFDLPFLLMKAKLRYSTPAFCWQVGLFSWLV